MKRYLVDSTPLAAYLQGRRGVVELLTPWVAARELATSVLVYGEIIEYLKGWPDFERRRQQLFSLLTEVQPFFLTYAIMDRYAEIRRQLRTPHGPGLIGDIDTLIAATAVEYDLVLVTADHDFERVSGLTTVVVRP